jgi:hypothetical protein
MAAHDVMDDLMVFIYSNLSGVLERQHDFFRNPGDVLSTRSMYNATCVT